MMKLAALTLASLVGVAGLATAVPAVAGPVVTVGMGVPGYAPGPYIYPRGPGYWHPDFYSRGFYHGYHGYYRGGHYGYRR